MIINRNKRVKISNTQQLRPFDLNSKMSEDNDQQNFEKVKNLNYAQRTNFLSRKLNLNIVFNDHNTFCGTCNGDESKYISLKELQQICIEKKRVKKTNLITLWRDLSSEYISRSDFINSLDFKANNTLFRQQYDVCFYNRMTNETVRPLYGAIIEQIMDTIHLRDKDNQMVLFHKPFSIFLDIEDDLSYAILLEDVLSFDFKWDNLLVGREAALVDSWGDDEKFAAYMEFDTLSDDQKARLYGYNYSIILTSWFSVCLSTSDITILKGNSKEYNKDTRKKFDFLSFVFKNDITSYFFNLPKELLDYILYLLSQYAAISIKDYKKFLNSVEKLVKRLLIVSQKCVYELNGYQEMQDSIISHLRRFPDVQPWSFQSPSSSRIYF